MLFQKLTVFAADFYTVTNNYFAWYFLSQLKQCQQRAQKTSITIRQNKDLSNRISKYGLWSNQFLLGPRPSTNSSTKFHWNPFITFSAIQPTKRQIERQTNGQTMSLRVAGVVILVQTTMFMVLSSIINALAQQEFTWQMQHSARRPPTCGPSRSAWATYPPIGSYSVYTSGFQTFLTTDPYSPQA